MKLKKPRFKVDPVLAKAFKDVHDKMGSHIAAATFFREHPSTYGAYRRGAIEISSRKKVLLLNRYAQFNQ